MKNTLPKPITKDNFPQCWEIVDTERRTARKKRMISTVAPFFSNQVLLVLVFIAGNGLIHDHVPGDYGDFLEELPFLLPIWQKYSALFLKPGQSWLLQTALTALVIFLICFVVFGFFTLVVTALYHPRRKRLPNGSDKECAEQMLDQARSARVSANQTGNDASALSIFLFFAAVAGILVAYVIMAQLSYEDIVAIFLPDADLSEPDPFGYVRNYLSFVIPAYVLLITFGFALLQQLHGLTVKPLCEYKIPYSFVAEVEYYATFVEENTEGMTEDDIRKQRAEAADAILKEALYLESIHAYGKAKQLLAQAAYGGNVSAMEHYARHHLLAHLKDPARYWLEKAVASGSASSWAVKTLKRLKWHRKIKDIRFLTEADLNETTVER